MQRIGVLGLSMMLAACAALPPPPTSDDTPVPEVITSVPVAPSATLETGPGAEASADLEPVEDPAPKAKVTEASAPSTPSSPAAARDGGDEIQRLCREIGTLLGSVSEQGCLDSALIHSGTLSRDGRSLAFVDFPAALTTAPRILVVGGIHGDEYASISLVFRWIERLDDEHRGDRNWRLIPAANPDGLLGVRPATRTNASGVDLNRNFATRNWSDEAEAQWISRTDRDPRRHPGIAPASEPETRWLQQLIASYAPDVIVSLHAPHALLDFDATDAAQLQAPERLGFLELQPLGTFPGSLGRYGSTEVGVPVLTLELPWAGIMPSPQDQEALWMDLRAWMTAHLPGVDPDATLTSSVEQHPGAESVDKAAARTDAGS